MATFNTTTDLRVKANLRLVADNIFTKYTWAGGPLQPVGRMLAEGTLTALEAAKILLSALLKSSGSTGPPPRELADQIAQEVVADAVAYTKSLADAEAARVASLALAQKSAREAYERELAASPYGVAVPLAPVKAETKAAWEAAAQVAVQTPVVAPSVAPEVKKMSMVQQALEVVKGVGGAVGSVIKAGAEVLPAAAQILAKSTPTQYSATGGMAAGYESLWRAIAPESALEPYRGQQIYPQPMGEQTTRGFRITAPGVRADRYIVQPHPVTGMPFYWEAVGRPVLFSRDIAACRRVNKIAKRAARARARYNPIRRRKAK